MAKRISGQAATHAGNDNHGRPPASPELIAAAGAVAVGHPTSIMLRLDEARHVRLRLACAIGGRSARAILIEALDAHLSTIPGIERLAAAAIAEGKDAATLWGTDR